MKNDKSLNGKLIHIAMCAFLYRQQLHSRWRKRAKRAHLKIARAAASTAVLEWQWNERKLRARENERNFLPKFSSALPWMRRRAPLINVRRMRNDATFHRARYLVAFEPANRKNRTTVRWRKFVKKGKEFLC